MGARPPIVLIEQAPRPLLLSRAAGAVDLAIREMPLCRPKVDRTASGGAMITSEDPMHRDLLIVHSQPGARGRIRIVNRLGDLAVGLVVPDVEPAALDRLRCGPDDRSAIAQATSVMRTVSAVLHAAAAARTAHRPRTVRHETMRRRIVERLVAVGTLLLGGDASGRTMTTIHAPTPWSSLCDGAGGPVDRGPSLWGRLRPVVSLSMLGVDTARNAWSIEMSPVRSDVVLNGDAMETLRILSTLPAARGSAGRRPDIRPDAS